MKSKENKELNPLYLGIGFMVALSCVISAFEWQTVFRNTPVTSNTISSELIELVHLTKQEMPEPPKVKKIAMKVVETKEELLEDSLVDFVFEMPEIVPLVVNVEPIEEEKADEIFLFVEEMPVPMEGYTEFYKKLSSMIKYPSKAQRMGIEGKVNLSFVVNERGEISEVQVLSGPGAGCDEEAVRVLKMMPPWKPGKQRAQAVKVRMVLPIWFKLQ